MLKAVIPQVYRALTGTKYPFLALIDTFIAIEVSAMLKQALALSLTTTKIKEQSPMSNLFQELKRRKVVRVAGVYAVVAWVLIQARSGYPWNGQDWGAKEPIIYS